MKLKGFPRKPGCSTLITSLYFVVWGHLFKNGNRGSSRLTSQPELGRSKKSLDSSSPNSFDHMGWWFQYRAADSERHKCKKGRDKSLPLFCYSRGNWLMWYKWKQFDIANRARPSKYFFSKKSNAWRMKNSPRKVWNCSDTMWNRRE